MLRSLLASASLGLGVLKYESRNIRTKFNVDAKAMATEMENPTITLERSVKYKGFSGL